MSTQVLENFVPLEHERVGVEGLPPAKFFRSMTPTENLLEALRYNDDSKAWNIAGMMILEGDFSRQRCVQLLKSRVTCYKAFRSKVVEENTKKLMRFHLEDLGADYNPDQNVRVIDASRWKGQQDLENFTTEVLGARFPRALPPWEMIICRRYLGNQTAVIGRFDHGLADGFTITQLLLSLTDPEEGESPTNGRCAQKSSGGSLLANLFATLYSLFLLVWYLPWALFILFVQPYIPDTPTAIQPTGKPRGPIRLCYMSPVSLAAMKRVAHTHDTKFASVAIALLMDTERRYLEAIGDHTLSKLGNRFAGSVCLTGDTRGVAVDAPIDEKLFGNKSLLIQIPVTFCPSAVSTLRGVANVMTKLKVSPFLCFAPLTLHLNNIIYWVLGNYLVSRVLDPTYTPEFKTLFLTTVKGPERRLCVGGLPVKEVRPFLNIANTWTVFNYGDNVACTYTADSDVVPDMSILRRCFQEACDSLSITGTSQIR
jgi:hypothetical protein